LARRRGGVDGDWGGVGGCVLIFQVISRQRNFIFALDSLELVRACVHLVDADFENYILIGTAS
jgi:hypothetical protein